MNNLKKTSEIVDNWYQSYYFWQNALNANSILNSNLSHHQSHDQRLLHNHSNQQTANNVPVVGLQRIRTELPVYKVPSMWKRFLAELIDAFYIQLVKLIIVLVLINYTSLVNEDSFKIFDFVEDILSEENISNIRLPFELLLLEFVYVLFSVLFEVS
jgi:hypothetical protein